MGLFDIFRRSKTEKPAAHDQAGRMDPQLLKRLGNIAAANTLVRGGQDPERLVLATNLDAEGKIDDSRPTMKFEFDALRTGPDHWEISAGIDDPVAYCRFSLGFELPEVPPLDPNTFDMTNAPSFRLTVSKPADHDRNPLARNKFLAFWRVDGGADAPSIEMPLQLDVTVMGVGLTRLPYMYVPTSKQNEHWVLLLTECRVGRRAPQPQVSVDTSSQA